MGTLAQLLIGLASTLPGRVLSSLGIGWLTFTGVSASADAVKSGLLSAWGSLPSDISMLFGLAGINTGVGIITGAFVAKAALSALPKLGKLVS